MARVNLKNIVLFVFKYAGLFFVTRFFYKNKLLILAYHGSEIVDEAAFNPNLFMRSATLRKRLDYLKRHKFNVLSLTDALEKLKSNTLPAKSIVLTFDDGWYSTESVADPLLNDYGFPYTIYVTTYYAEAQQPVLNVLLRYIFFKSTKKSVSSQSVCLEGEEVFDLTNVAQKSQCFNKAFNQLSQYPEREQRELFVFNVAVALGVDLSVVINQRCFHLMTPDSLASFAKKGVDLQLHTHKHNVDLNNLVALPADIACNKALIQQYAGYTPKHFCYPSGVHDESTENILRQSKVISATTCLPGFTYSHTNFYYLPRFLDGENISQLLFEAEVSGVLEFFRKVKQSLTGFRQHKAKA